MSFEVLIDGAQYFYYHLPALATAISFDFPLTVPG